MALVVPQVPHKSPVINDDGYLTAPWSAWFRQLFLRIGGATALTNTELEALQATDLATTNANVTTIQGQIATLLNNINDLNQGRQL